MSSSFQKFNPHTVFDREVPYGNSPVTVIREPDVNEERSDEEAEDYPYSRRGYKRNPGRGGPENATMDYKSYYSTPGLNVFAPLEASGFQPGNIATTTTTTPAPNVSFTKDNFISVVLPSIKKSNKFTFKPSL